MDRSEQIRQEGNRIMEPKLWNSMVDLLAAFKREEDKHLRKLQDALQNLIILTVKQQQEETKGAVHFLGICYCKSSIYTRNFELKLDFYAKDFYLDEAESSVYWNPDFLTNYLVSDIAYFEKKIRQCVPRVRTFEIQQYLIGYMNNYMHILEEFLKQRLPEVLDQLSFKELKVEDKIMIFFGEYMGRFSVLQDMVIEAEGKKDEVF